jgi:chaperonin GroEL (HSP60 family)
MIKLTDEQVTRWEEIAVDERANNESLEVAIRSHREKQREIVCKKESEWKNLGKEYGLDLARGKYQVNMAEGIIEPYAKKCIE